MLLALVPSAARATEEVHLSRDEAIIRALPGVVRLEAARFSFTEEERAELGRERGVTIPAGEHELLRGFDQRDRPIGLAMFVDEIGKFRPITFIVALTNERKVRDVAVCVYRENHGGEITRRRFLKQFRDKAVGDELRLGREVIHISGATLSCRATIRAVERVLAVVEAKHDAKKGFAGLSFTALTMPEVGALSPIHTTRRLAMGTLLDVSIDAEPLLAARGADAVFEEVEAVRRALDGRLPTSDIGRLLAAPPATAVPVDARTLDALARAFEVSRLSGGAFDPTLVADGWREVTLDRTAGTVTRSARITRLDLGAIGKGIALDRAAQRLRSLGIDRALLNFGGQVLAMAPPRGSDGWSVAIASPADDGSVIALHTLAEASLACSGLQHRGDHLIDPATGTAATIPPLTTVFAADATTADAWSTACALVEGVETQVAVEVPALHAVERWSASSPGLADVDDR